MKTKVPLKLKKYINPEIKVDDIVRIHDGSWLHCIEKPEIGIYIIISYPQLFGVYNKVKDLNCKVIAINEEYISQPDPGIDSVTLLDVKLQIGNYTFRTCSKFLNKVK